MAYTQHIQLLLFFLALPTYLEIQFTEGRQLKAMNEHELTPTKNERGMENHAKQAINVGQSLGNHKDNLEVIGQKKVLLPMSPTQSHEFSSSDVSREDAFQPTVPGNSPGVGHSFAGQKHNVQANVRGFTTDAVKTDDFESTTLGHSPGVGHSFGN